MKPSTFRASAFGARPGMTQTAKILRQKKHLLPVKALTAPYSLSAETATVRPKSER